MITLDLPPHVEQIIVEQSKRQGVSIEHYIISLLPTHPDSFYEAKGLMRGKLNEMLSHQQQLRDEWA